MNKTHRALVAVAFVSVLFLTGCVPNFRKDSLERACAYAEFLSEAQNFAKSYNKLIEIINERDALNVSIHDDRLDQSVREDLQIRRSEVLTRAQEAVDSFGEHIKKLEAIIKVCHRDIVNANMDSSNQADNAILDRLDRAEKRLPALKSTVASIEADFAQYQMGKPMPGSLKR